MDVIEPQAVRELDDLLKCGICHETLVTPVLTSCSHTYCSLCIRKWLATKQICPSCGNDTYESSLRKLPILSNILEAWQRITTGKKRTVDRAHTPDPSHSIVLMSPGPQAKQSQKINYHVDGRCENDHDDGDFVANFQSPSSSKMPSEVDARIKPMKSTPSPRPKNCHYSNDQGPTTPKTQGNQQSSTPGDLTPHIGKKSSTHSQKVLCPVCSTMILETIINVHLDKCLNGGFTRSTTSSKHVDTIPASLTTPKTIKKMSLAESPNTRTTLEPIKKMVYNLLNDTQLKRELKKYGLSTQGDRRTLAGRLQRYVLFHNAECDSMNPRSQAELLKQFEKEEKALTMPTSSNKFSQMFKTKQPDEKEFTIARKHYITENKKSFASLINDVKNRGLKKLPAHKTSVEPVVNLLSEDEDDPAPVCIKNSVKGSDVSDDSEDMPKTPVIKPIKRKIASIESDSEDNDEHEQCRELKQDRSSSSSPVLTKKVPVRRQLRGRGASSKPEPDYEPSTARTRSQSKTTAIKKKSKTGAGVQKAPASSTSKEAPRKKDFTSSDKEESLFDTPPSPTSSDLPCGQPQEQQQKSRDDSDNLSQLLSLMEDQNDEDSDSGSATDFEN